MIAPLQPHFWRIIQLDKAARITRNGALVHFVLGDVWRLEQASKGTSPLAELSRWDDYVKRTLQSIPRSTAAQYYLELWNEPDASIFWEFPDEDLFKLYVHTAKLIKAYNPAIKVGGPSFSRYDKPGIAAFLKYASEQNAAVDFLTWHELVTETGRLQPNVREAKALVKSIFPANPRLAENIFISEYGGPSQQYDLPANFDFLYNFLAADVAGAGKSCWNDGQKDNCWDASIDGLLDGNKQPRAIWYMYMMFVEGIAQYYPVEDQRGEVLILASEIKRSYRLLISRSLLAPVENRDQLVIDFRNIDLGKKKALFAPSS